jgi:myo-inositol 2-dehydrogenase / D-chiro-inositol 1-dehydrogenase
MTLAVGVIGPAVMGAEHARLLRQGTSGAHLADMRALLAIEAAAGTGRSQPITSPPRHPTPDMARIVPVTTHRLLV